MLFSIPTSIIEGPAPLRPQWPVVWSTFVIQPSNKCAMVPHCGFNLHFLMTNGVEHFFMCLFIIHLSLEKRLFKSLMHFSIGFFFNWISKVLNLFWIQILYHIDDFQIFFSRSVALFILLTVFVFLFFKEAEVLNFDKIQFIYLFRGASLFSCYV